MSTFILQMPFAALEPFIGIAQLSGYLNRAGRKAQVFDVSTDLFYRHRVQDRDPWTEGTQTMWRDGEFVKQFFEKDRPWLEKEYIEPIVRSERPFVGFSVSTDSFAASIWMARLIKSCRADVFIVFGGEVFSGSALSPRQEICDALVTGVVDAVVSGDGEETLAELLERVEAGRSLEGCRGLWTRNGAGQPVFSGPRRAVCLDDLPFADYSQFELARYGTARMTSHDMVMMASRGCVRACTFCGHWLYWPGFRQMSGERVFEEIQYQRRVLPGLNHDDSQIKFYDLLINGDMQKLNRLCDLLIADSKSKLLWQEANAVIRPEMTYEMCRKMYEAGCRWLIIGLESGSQKVLDLMRKRQTVEQMKDTLRNIDRAGLKVRGNFMFGFPGESEDDFQMTLDFLEEMWPYIHIVYPSYTMTHLDGVLVKNAASLGVDPAHQDSLYWESNDGNNTYLTRLDRLSRFRKRAVSLGADLRDGLDGSWEAYLSFCLGGYHLHKGDGREALNQYKRYQELDPANDFVNGRVRELEGRPVVLAGRA